MDMQILSELHDRNYGTSSSVYTVQFQLKHSQFLHKYSP